MEREIRSGMQGVPEAGEGEGEGGEPAKHANANG